MKTDKLRTAFVTALGLPPGVSVDHARYGETEGWDSVAHMALVAEIEGAFEIMFDTEEVLEMSSFAKAVEILKAHGIQLES